MAYADSETGEEVRQAMGAVLRRRREEAERTLAQVAQTAGISIAHLSEVERGVKEMSVDKVVAIMRALDGSPAEFFLEVARQLGSREALQQRNSWPDDPRMQLRLATQTLRPNALRSVADFSLYLAATQTAPKRRIGFTVDR